MRAVIQRVRYARVTVDGAVTGEIGPGILVLLGVQADDTEKDGAWLAAKIAHLRILADDAGKMNDSLIDSAGGVLVGSQFTLYGDCRRGRRPSFVGAAPPAHAEPLYERFCVQIAEEGIATVERGIFGAMMDVELLNDGPVTLVIDTP